MKILSFLILTCFTLFAQQNEVNQKLENLFNKLDSDYVRYEQNYYNLNLSQKELDTLVKQIYELYSFHWLKSQDFSHKRREQNEKEFYESSGKIPLHKPVLGMIRRKIDENKGENYFDIITVPYYFKLKILEIDHFRKHKSGGDYYPKTTMLCEIIETVKGEHLFNDGDKIELNYLNHWDVGKYEEGEIYFMPVRPWNYKDPTNIEYSPNLFPVDKLSMEGGSFGVYPIENNIIKNAEYFQIQDKEWKVFLRKFKDLYILEVEK